MHAYTHTHTHRKQYPSTNSFLPINNRWNNLQTLKPIFANLQESETGLLEKDQYIKYE